MDPFSRGMKMVRLAQQKEKSQSSGSDNRLTAVLEPEKRYRTSTPIRTSEGEPGTSLHHEISFSEFVPLSEVHNILTTQHEIDDSFSCYFPPVKESILTRGNEVANFNDVTFFNTPTEYVVQPFITTTEKQNDYEENLQGDFTSHQEDVHTFAAVSNTAIEVDVDKGQVDSVETDPMLSTTPCSVVQHFITTKEQQNDHEEMLQGDLTSHQEDVLTQVAVHDTATEVDVDKDQVDSVETDPMLSTTPCSVVQHFITTKEQQNDHEEMFQGDLTSHQEDVLTQVAVHDTATEVDVDKDQDEMVSQVSTEQVEMPVKTKRKKADINSWKKNINKAKRAKGEPYIGRIYQKGTSKYKSVEKPAKIIGDRCNCKTVGVQCSEITDDVRNVIHKEVWSMSWPQREVLVKSLVHKNEVGRHRVEQSQSSRQNTLVYNLNVANGLIKVCKKMFLSTTGITQHFIRTHVLRKEDNIQPDRRPIISSSRMNIKQFLESLPSMPSHYCRKSSTKVYLEPVFNSKAEVYHTYKEWSREKDVTSASRQVFTDEFEKGNFALFQPRKDQCDLCVSYSEGNIDEDTYLQHRLKKDQAQKAKEEDKRRAAESNGKIKMVSMDLQAVLLAPSLKASALYYRTKLTVHNFTVFECTQKDVRCYLWHEVEGGLTANEFASCICDFISKDLSFEEFIIYSDGCNYQNRNATLSKALTYMAQKHSKTTHKILEKGHTQMEVDSVHHMIENKLKNKSIYCPSDYQKYIEEARQKPFPYKVDYLEYTFFQNFADVCGLKSIRPGKKAGEPQVVDIRCLQYTPDGRILYKLVHDEEWQELIVRGNSTRIDKEPTPLLAHQRRIPASKFKHLQELKSVIPRDLYAFYDALPHD